MARSMVSRGEGGFTLVELLTVVAIIGVLVSFSIPMFSGMTDKAKASVDEANVQTAKSLAVAQYMTERTTGTVKYYFDAASGTVKTALSGIRGYGKSKSAVTGAQGVPNPTGNNPNVLSVTVSNGGSLVEAVWGVMANRSIVTTESLQQSTMAERIAQDATLLDALQVAVQDMTVSEFAALLGNNDLKHRDFMIAVTKAQAPGQQSKTDKFVLLNQYIVGGFEGLFESVGVDVDKVNAKEERLLVTPGSGNDVRIKVYVGAVNGMKSDLYYILEKYPDAKLSNAYVYLDPHDWDSQFESLYTNERAKTVQ